MLISVQPKSRGKITDELKAFYLAKTKRELTLVNYVCYRFYFIVDSITVLFLLVTLTLKKS